MLRVNRHRRDVGGTGEVGRGGGITIRDSETAVDETNGWVVGQRAGDVWQPLAVKRSLV